MGFVCMCVYLGVSACSVVIYHEVVLPVPEETHALFVFTILMQIST